MKALYAVLLLIILPAAAQAQLLQRVKGQVTDRETHAPLEGVIVAVPAVPGRAAMTDSAGFYVLDSIPVGKQTILFSYPTYQEQRIPDVLVTSGKEVMLDLLMQESVQKLSEQVVAVQRRAQNEMAIVSTRGFDVQETERYAGSRADPARMASNFAGVQGADDSRNDIIVRGNSPAGILWRIEEVDIPNPNHFAIPGTSGGPVSMLNNKTLANSDFLSGAFPADYGNSTSAAFDLKLRNGNKDRYEMTAQFGFLGTELTAEGPLSRRGATFLVAYRYSTLKIFEGLNIKIGTSSVPNYQDLSFKVNIPVGKKGNLGFFGVGGLSNIDLIVSKLTEPSQELYGESDRDQYFSSNTGFGGLSYTHTFNRNFYMKVVSAFSANDIFANHDKVFRNADYGIDSMKPILGYRFLTKAWNTHMYAVRKLSARHTLKAGILANVYMMDYIDSSRQYPPTRQDWANRLDFSGSTSLLQGYVQYKFRPTDRLSLVGGLHAQYLSHNGSAAVEPRFSARYNIDARHTLSLGYGLHSQMQGLYQYFAHLAQSPAGYHFNSGMGFTRSHHFAGGYDFSASRAFRLRAEVYYQHLFNIPIETRAGSSFSLINQGSSFSRLFPDTLKNAGTGDNYGLELTLERSFRNNWYALFTGSLYNSSYIGNDGIRRSTDYNGRFAANVLAGYEPHLSANTTLILGLKVTWAGGRLYSIPDTAASNALGDFVVVDTLRNSERFRDYFRADLRTGIRINRPRVTHEIAIDLVNVFGIKNILNLTYSADLAAQGLYPFYETYQLGFLPLFYYRLDFGIRRKG